jgi:adenylate kinase family enzyme
LPSNTELTQQITDKVLEQIDLGASTPIVLIDGRSNSGKSTFAKSLQENLFKQGESLPRVIHMDDLYPGWEGLSLGVDYLNRFILEPVSKKETASWQQWDWLNNQRGAWVEFSGGTPLIIEGCGAISERASSVAFLRLWLEAPEPLRQSRWLEREGNLDRFDMWAAQELDFYAREKSSSLADLVIATDG